MKNIKRRDALKVAVAVGGLMALEGTATAQQNNRRTHSFAGSWQFQGEPCAIFQQGAVLLAVNEKGALATAQVTGPTSLLILAGEGWDTGLTGQLVDRDRRIDWSNNSSWVRV